MAGVDIYRGSQGVELPPEVSKEILSDMRRESIVQRLARPVRVPGAGLTIPVITDDPEADWVDETEEKPVSRAGFSSVSLKPYCAAVIQPFSKQFARDLTGLYTECRARMPGALAKKFDRTCFGFDDTPGTGFNDLDDAPTIALDDEDMYGSAIAALRSVVGSHEGADLTAWAIDPLAEVEFLAALDNNGRPLFTLSPAADGSVGEVLARPVFKSSHVTDGNVVGIAGDWKSAIWGWVSGVSMSISEEATLTDVDNKLLNLWQRNMIAVRCEVEIGFAPVDPGRFVKLTSAGRTEGTPVKNAAKKVAD